MKLSIDVIREYLQYDMETGWFYWKKPSSDKSKVGSRAGRSRSVGGYRQLTLLWRTMYEHRLAWFYVHGEVPVDRPIDHINGNKWDNRISNLRLATPTENLANIRAKRDNVSGCKNVHWCTTKSRWIAKVKRAGRSIHIGTFRQYDEAVTAAKEARIKTFGAFASQLGCEADT